MSSVSKNSLSVKTRNALVKKKMFTYEGLACCHMTSTSIATTCELIDFKKNIVSVQ